jgi:hypothetical protein
MSYPTAYTYSTTFQYFSNIGSKKSVPPALNAPSSCSILRGTSSRRLGRHCVGCDPCAHRDILNCLLEPGRLDLRLLLQYDDTRMRSIASVHRKSLWYSHQYTRAHKSLLTPKCHNVKALALPTRRAVCART